ncbi:LuxR C-terminal-related transcriptional regulator [Amycolatopsis jiangsuensis]|uniref:DNA-binding CsgD family transcriptional regulator n=1 Tax=Amycolatopsis jiangsuensis TaxID=1181879 RepID=A0A840ISX9_9PSEU|nr:LuxR C-terminal-related transcriptional regulator [Amycolatopsis jiangsuensis]MBB4684094.1 DNA-binding CsgD family transcriptional regulator [Amycolatopsis jiangsuensis]
MHLTALREVVEGPLHGIAGRFSRFLGERWPHTALVIFTRECTGRPRKVAGPVGTVDRITIAELEDLKAATAPGEPLSTTATIGGRARAVWAVRDRTGTLLVLVTRTAKRLPEPALLAEVFGIVATSIRQQVTQASPDYLAESRAASAERARTIGEMAAAQESALVAILTTLRSRSLDDRHARLTATDSAATALVTLRSARTSDLAVSEEPPLSAFTKLRKEIRQILRHHDAELEFSAPPRSAPPLPGEIAHAARALTRTSVLAFTAQPDLARLRIAWSCDGVSLRIDVRDHESGRLDVAAVRDQLDGRARALGGTVEFDAVPEWGSRASITLPLHVAPDRSGEDPLSGLNRRELQVLGLVAQGKRNKTIAGELGITESTVKFHVTGVLKKLDAGSRGEAAALALAAGIGDHVRN